MSFLPITKAQMKKQGWQCPDIVAVTGDAYVDHPSFGVAIISRVLEAQGFNVCILAQPQSIEDFKRFGKPRLGFFITSGNIDSMVAHYTVAKRKRNQDAYSPGNKAGLRPDRACIVYSKQARLAYEDTKIILGGLEASLRRFAHYDYWDNKVLPSILVQSQADILVFGMGENQVVEIANRLDKNKPLSDIRGTCQAIPTQEYVGRPCAECPSYEMVRTNKQEYSIATRIQQEEQDDVSGRTVIQRNGDVIVVQHPPAPILTTQQMDNVYELPYMRDYHPVYEKAGGVPAIQEVKFSITHVRGCFGACNFCSLAYHQGRRISTRSKQSLVAEATKLTQYEDFKGYIHDVGGPTANFRIPSCTKQETKGMCKNRKCLAPDPCKQLDYDHNKYLDILKSLRQIPGVKKVFIRSGIRYDYLMQDKFGDDFFKQLVMHHVSGQLKVAPEHCSTHVLGAMGKSNFKLYTDFKNRFYQLTKSIGKEQYLVPYLMSSHPGSTMNDAIELALFLKKEKLRPEQVQDFYPTPGTVSTSMYHTGLDPWTLKPIYVPKGKQKTQQRAMLQYFIPQNKGTVIAALEKAGRQDLIGYGEDCLVTPQKQNSKKPSKQGKNQPRQRKNQSRQRKNRHRK